MTREVFEALIERPGTWSGELTHMTRDGRKIVVETLQQAQAAPDARVTRLTTLGEVTASFAHELNQPLAAIVNNANSCHGLLTSRREDLAEVRETLSDIVSDADRASAVIGRVREMANRSEPARYRSDSRTSSDDVVALAATESIARRVAIRTEVPADLPMVPVTAYSCSRCS